MGRGQEDLIKRYSEEHLKGRLHYLGEKSTEECDNILADADILVNIGNTVQNQVPSKLFHYIGFGKPILNVIACEDCPTISYMKRYELSCTVKDVNDVFGEAKKVQQWIIDNYKKRISLDKNKQIFEDCTPEYISNKIVSQIKECAKNRTLEEK